MTPFVRAWLIRRINSMTTQQALRRWWDNDCGDHAKLDASIVAAKNDKKRELSKK